MSTTAPQAAASQAAPAPKPTAPKAALPDCELLLLRDDKQEAPAKRTFGTLSIDGARFCHTLEDPVRPAGVKIYGDTAIPAGRYRVRVCMSPTFKRLTPRLEGVPGYEGVLLHGGNDEHDTKGCPLVCFHRMPGKIYGSAENELTRRLLAVEEAGRPIWLTVR